MHVFLINMQKTDKYPVFKAKHDVHLQDIYF
jgi:hypothetical protein